jgi:ribosomal protein L7/L12
MAGRYTEETLTAHFEQVNKRLAAIEEQLGRLSSAAGVPYSQPLASVPRDVIELARSGDRLGAIKRYRELTNCGFEEAREVVVGL